MKLQPYSLLLFVTMLWSSFAIAQNTITIPYDTSASIDGLAQLNEWSAADSLTFATQGGSQTMRVYYSHDSVNLHLAFSGPLESANARFPEVLMDINFSQSSTWENDDWWFHVSATDCEYQGQHSNYDSCQTVRPNWTGADNFVTGPPMTDFVEIEIPFATVGIDINTVDTIGISFEVTNTFSAWEYWPSTASIDTPSTWGKAVFGSDQPNLGQEELTAEKRLQIFPNPNSGDFTLRFDQQDLPESFQVKVMDILGNELLSEPSTRFGKGELERSYSMNDLPSGIYLVGISSEEGDFFRKMVIQ